MNAQETLRRAGRWSMRGRRRRMVYDRLAAAVRIAPPTPVLRGPAKGLRFRGGDTPGYRLGMSEPIVQDLLSEHLRRGGVFYDIGANAGFTAMLAARLVGPTGHVHCFEPVPANAAVLRRNLGRNGFSNFEIHEIAVGERTGTVGIAVGDRAITAAVVEHSTLMVPLVALDDIDLAVPDVIKIDVEGSESRVLAGAQRLLERSRPVLVIEIHGDEESPVRAVLGDAGYSRVERLDDGGMPHLLALP